MSKTAAVACFHWLPQAEAEFVPFFQKGSGLIPGVFRSVWERPLPETLQSQSDSVIDKIIYKYSGSMIQYLIQRKAAQGMIGQTPVQNRAMKAYCTKTKGLMRHTSVDKVIND